MTDFGLEKATVRYGSQVAIEALDVVVRPGSITALVGSDGAGKSTSAKALVGLVSLAEGVAHRPSVEQLGYQPEAGGSWPDLTVGENLDFVGSAYRGDSAERRTELLVATGLSAAIDRRSEDLSGGMRQKLAVAMAVLPRPLLVVLDEPTTGLDPVSRAELWRMLFRVAAEGTAVLVTTSYLDEAERADHVVVVEGGRAIASGTAAAIRAGFEGAVAVTADPPPTTRTWRRGRQWRSWYPPGEHPLGEVVPPTLEDVVTVASLFGTVMS